METLLPRRTSFSTAGKQLSGENSSTSNHNVGSRESKHRDIHSSGLSLGGMHSNSKTGIGRSTSSSYGLTPGSAGSRYSLGGMRDSLSRNKDRHDDDPTDNHHHEGSGGSRKYSSSRFGTSAEKTRDSLRNITNPNPGGTRPTSSSTEKEPVEEELVIPSSTQYLYPKNDVLRLLKGKKEVRPVGAGLRNMGNTCYLNSVLQALTYTAPFAAYLLSGEHQKRCDHQSQVCMTCIFEKHVQEIFDSRSAVTPRDILSRLKNISKNLQVGRQEDAHEFLRAFLDACSRSFIPERGKKEKQQDAMAMAIANTTLVHQIFGGYLRSQVRCSSCNFCSNTYDPFLDLSLELNNCSSVQLALRQFTDTETLSGSNKYKCSKCKKLVCAQKQFLIHTAPKILTIQLKRFNFGMGLSGEKINKPISFPFDLDLAPYTSNKEKPASYRLYAVTVHSGSSSKSGHYFSYARNIGSNLWYRFDDESVSQVSQDVVTRAQAYLLYYEMKENCIPSPRMSKIEKEHKSVERILEYIGE